MQFQQAQGHGQQQKQQVSETPAFNDRDFLNEMITLEKHSSTLYHTACTEASNPSLHQTCSNLMQETLQCQQKLFQLMSQKGWYSTQSADQQQVDQEYQKFQGYMQTQFPKDQ